MKTTHKTLDILIAQIATLLGLATNEQQAKEKGLTKYLYLEHAAIYGGYRVISIQVGTGRQNGALGGNGCEARLSAKEMEIKLRGIITGVKLIKELTYKNL